MKITGKPTRKTLLKVIGELQGLVGAAHGLHNNDRSPTGFEEAQDKLTEAHELCIEALSYDPPQ